MIIAFPGRAILVTEIAALWRQLAVGNANHDVLDGFAVGHLTWPANNSSAATVNFLPIGIGSILRQRSNRP